jgi:toxin YoeB
VKYILLFSQQTEEDLIFYKKSGNKAILKKIIAFLEEIVEHPYSGTGKPEPLKHDLTGKWSRRINKEHRLVYEVLDDSILLHSARGHYE